MSPCSAKHGSFHLITDLNLSPSTLLSKKLFSQRLLWYLGSHSVIERPVIAFFAVTYSAICSQSSITLALIVTLPTKGIEFE
jgi:hypothetical protein